MFVGTARELSKRYGWDKEGGMKALREWSDRLGVWAIPAYVGVHTLTLALCLPYAVFFEAAASLIFGFFPAVVCVFSAKVLAASLSFGIGRSVPLPFFKLSDANNILLEGLTCFNFLILICNICNYSNIALGVCRNLKLISHEWGIFFFSNTYIEIIINMLVVHSTLERICNVSWLINVLFFTQWWKKAWQALHDFESFLVLLFR